MTAGLAEPVMENGSHAGAGASLSRIGSLSSSSGIPIVSEKIEHIGD